METKEQLQEKLRRLDEEITEIRNKTAPSTEDVKRLKDLCDEVEAIDAKMRVQEAISGGSYQTFSSPSLGSRQAPEDLIILSVSR